MPVRTTRRGIASVHLLVGLAAEHGLPMGASLRGSGIAPKLLREPAAEVETHQELAVVRNIVRNLAHEPGIGLVAGSRYQLTAYGIWGYAFLASRTLRSALELGVRYLDLTFAFTRFRVDPRRDELQMTMDDSEIPEDCRQFLLERDASAAVALHRPSAWPRARCTATSPRSVSTSGSSSAKCGVLSPRGCCPNA